MNVAELDWRQLIALLQQDLRTRFVTGRRLEMSDLYEGVWGEFRVRLSNLARVIVPRHSMLRREMIDDLVQQVMLRFQSEEMLGRLAAADSPQSYLAAVIRNASTDVERATARSRTLIENVSSVMFLSNRQTETTEVRQLLNSLPAADRLLLHMRFWRGLTITEIAAELDISYSAAAMRIMRLLRKLREGEAM